MLESSGLRTLVLARTLYSLHQLLKATEPGNLWVQAEQDDPCRISALTGRSVKGKLAQLWFVKSNSEIKTCMAELGRNIVIHRRPFLSVLETIL